MLPKDNSTTKSWKSLTPDSRVQYLKGVGPRLSSVFEKKGILTIRDLFYFLPRTYEDRSKVHQVKDAVTGETARFRVTIRTSKKIPLGRSGKFLFEVYATDETGGLRLLWFRWPPGMEYRFKAGEEIWVRGEVELYRERPQLTHPEVSFSAALPTHELTGYSPIYREIEGIPSRTFRTLLAQAFESLFATLDETLPPWLLQKYKLPALPVSLQSLHFPKHEEVAQYGLEAYREFTTPFQQRLIFEECFFFLLKLEKNRRLLEQRKTAAVAPENLRAVENDLFSTLPFTLTDGQKKTVGEIFSDLARTRPMNRLLQGDVGSGKTVVALLACAAVIADGGQVAFLVPTEIVAQQHFETAQQLFGRLFSIALLTGSTSTAERNAVDQLMNTGKPSLLIGTHAILEDPVQFKNLRFVIIDEQHRFGVNQRRALLEKGRHPHVLSMTATPIPRTLTLALFGDVDQSQILEKPKNRRPILTALVDTEFKRHEMHRTIATQLNEGRQAYFIYPRIEETEESIEKGLQTKTAVEAFDEVCRQYQNYQVGLLHGRLKDKEKLKVMTDFKEGRLHILVSTTVVEVGVDVPNATIMCIENAERFGLSQLHQLRGRVGRSAYESRCYLLPSPRVHPDSLARLNALVNNENGFKLAEIDLELRGPGEVLGFRQSGIESFKYVSLSRDREWFERSAQEVHYILSLDPSLDLEENRPLRHAIGQGDFSSLRA